MFCQEVSPEGNAQSGRVVYPRWLIALNISGGKPAFRTGASLRVEHFFRTEHDFLDEH
jgi:hypothetical protein